jgi:GTP cyclohydrolase I
MMVASHIACSSLCEHDCLPFSGVVPASTPAPRGAGVVLEAEHACMSRRGVRGAGAKTMTSALSGLVGGGEPTPTEFLALTRAPS